MKVHENISATSCIYERRGLDSRKQGGFSFLELIIVIVIISILFTVAVDKLLVLKVEAERTAMAQILGSLRSAMAIQVASHISSDRVSELANNVNANPMDWLSEKPNNYIGTLDEPDPADVQASQWYFDSYNKWLVYRVNHGDYFSSTLKGPKRARFRINLDYTDSDGDGEYNANIDEIHGLMLESMEPYQWLAEPVDIKDYVSQNDETLKDKQVAAPN